MVVTCALMDIRASQAMDRSRRHHFLQFTFMSHRSKLVCVVENPRKVFRFDPPRTASLRDRAPKATAPEASCAMPLSFPVTYSRPNNGKMHGVLRKTAVQVCWKETESSLQRHTSNVHIRTAQHSFNHIAENFGC